MVLYLASDEAAWVTGGAFPIDGGMTSFVRRCPMRMVNVTRRGDEVPVSWPRRRNSSRDCSNLWTSTHILSSAA